MQRDRVARRPSRSRSPRSTSACGDRRSPRARSARRPTVVLTRSHARDVVGARPRATPASSRRSRSGSARAQRRLELARCARSRARAPPRPLAASVRTAASARGEQVVARRGRDVLAVGLLHQLGVHARPRASGSAPSAAGRRRACASTARATSAPAVHRARGRSGWKCRCPPQASSTITIACARGLVHGLPRSPRVFAAQPLVGRARVDDGERLGVAAQALERPRSTLGGSSASKRGS